MNVNDMQSNSPWETMTISFIRCIILQKLDQYRLFSSARSTTLELVYFWESCKLNSLSHLWSGTSFLPMTRAAQANFRKPECCPSNGIEVLKMYIQKTWIHTFFFGKIPPRSTWIYKDTIALPPKQPCGSPDLALTISVFQEFIPIFIRIHCVIAKMSKIIQKKHQNKITKISKMEQKNNNKNIIKKCQKQQKKWEKTKVVDTFKQLPPETWANQEGSNWRALHDRGSRRSPAGKMLSGETRWVGAWS